MQEFLKGKKTIITGIIIFIVGGLRASGVDIPEGVIEALVGVLGISLRLGIKKENV